MSLIEHMEMLHAMLSASCTWGKVVLGLKPPVLEGFAGICLYPRASNDALTEDTARTEHEIAVEIHYQPSASVIDFLGKVEEVVTILRDYQWITDLRINYQPGNWAEIAVTIPELGIGR